jgi:hypothetical protein
LTTIALTGHYSGFFAEIGRNGPSFSATGPVDTGLVRRFYRNPYPSGTSPAARNQGFSGSAGADYRASDAEDRDQFLPSGDGNEGLDQLLPPHKPQIHSDSPLLRSGERTRTIGSRNWEYPPRIDRGNITRPHGNADLYSSRKRSIVTQFDSGRDWGVGDNRSEIGRFERYGVGCGDGRADYEGSNKDTSFFHGWRRDRGNSGVIARHSSSTTSQNSGELRGRGSLSVGSAHDSLHATILSSNQDFDQPSPSKRPRLGWGQGLAKYEKKVDDLSPAVDKTNMRKDGEGYGRPTVDEVEKNRGVEHEKLIVQEWEHEYKRHHADSSIDAHKRRGENERKAVLIRKHGLREVNAQDVCCCALSGDSLRREDERKVSVARELQGLEGRHASPVEMEDDENIGAVFNDCEEPSRRPPILAEYSEGRRKDHEASGMLLEERESPAGKDQNLRPSVLVGEPKRRQGEIAKSSALVEKSEDVLEGSSRNASLAEPLNYVKHDFSIADTLTKAEKRESNISSSSTSVTYCDIGGRRIEAAVSFSSTPHSGINAEDRDVVSHSDTSPEMFSTGCGKQNSPRSRFVDVFLTAPTPLLLAEPVVLPASSPNRTSTSKCKLVHSAYSALV